MCRRLDFLGELAMKKLIFALAIAGALPWIAACDQTMEQEAQDVREAHQDAVENVAEEQKDVEDAAREGAKNVVEEQRDVEDAAREGTKAITDEQRELEDAARREAAKNIPDVPPPSTVP
jgi:hypothetical protein